MSAPAPRMGAPAPMMSASPGRMGAPNRGGLARGRARVDLSLPAEFYSRPVLDVGRELIGCVVEHEGLAGMIVETEAYHETEPACHAFVGLTQRTRPLFGEPGIAYVYRSYGIHALLNAVCEPAGVGVAGAGVAGEGSFGGASPPPLDPPPPVPCVAGVTSRVSPVLFE
jgi:hypothetical protein